MTINALLDFPEAGTVAIPRCVAAFFVSTAAPTLFTSFGVVVASLVKNGVGDVTIALAADNNTKAFFASASPDTLFAQCLKPDGTHIQVVLLDKGGAPVDGSVYVSLWKYP